VLEILVVPACFLGAGLVGYRLGTPGRVAGGLAVVGCAHLLAFLGGNQALASDGAVADWIHLSSQLLFVGGFVAFVWLAAVYPNQKPPVKVVTAAAALGAAGPCLAAVSGPTPAVLDETRELGPVVHLLPASAANFAVTPLLLLPVLAVIMFVVRYRRVGHDDRAAMRWPIAGLGVLAALVAAGTLLSFEQQGVVTALFLLGAPIFPLTLAFGPVLGHIDSLKGELAEIRQRAGHSVRPGSPPELLTRFTPRELEVLEGMAEGKSNPEIARTLHLSLSSVEKHATAIFRKLEVSDTPTAHRRVSAVVAYRDALEGAREEAPGPK
jgi:DNA-binding CsgD family transcriptional regulator